MYNCTHCGAAFTAYRGQSVKAAPKYCTRACYNASKTLDRTRLIAIPCTTCGKQFEREARRVHKEANFCSKQCAGAAIQTRTSAVCSVCESPFNVIPAKTGARKYCSKACADTARTKHKPVLLNCIICKADFQRRANRIRTAVSYCSVACRSLRQGPPITVQCTQCGVSFNKKAHRKAVNDFCSAACKAKRGVASWLEQVGDKSATLYLLRFFDSNESFYKIGVTSRSIKQRYADKRGMLGYSYEIICSHVSQALRVLEWEQSILSTFAQFKYKPQRPITGRTECFAGTIEVEQAILQVFPL